MAIHDVTHLTVGDVLPRMPLFLSADAYVNLPLADAYDAAWRGVPNYWRETLMQTPGGA